MKNNDHKKIIIELIFVITKNKKLKQVFWFLINMKKKSLVKSGGRMKDNNQHFPFNYHAWRLLGTWFYDFSSPH